MKATVFEDPRSPLEKLRRNELRSYLQGHGATFNPDAPATTMRAIARDMGLDGQDFTGIPKPQIVDPEEVIKPLEEMSMPDLRKACKAAGLEQSNTDTADVLRSKLRDQNAP